METCTEIQALMEHNLNVFRSLWKKYQGSAYALMAGNWVVFYNTIDDGSTCV